MGAETQLFWITARAAGVTAVILASLSVAAGLLIGTRWKRLPDLRGAHEALSLATLAVILLHGLALLGDPWLKPGLGGLLVPFEIGYRPVAVAAGVIAAYGFGVLGLSYYLRGRLGPARWRRAHRWTALFWVLALVHGFTSGTDAGEPWFQLSVAAVVVPAAGLLLARLFRSRGPQARAHPPARIASPTQV